MRGFQISTIKHGLLHDRFDEEFPTRVYGWAAESGRLCLSDKYSSFFGYVFNGPTKLRYDAGHYDLSSGQYFCVHEGLELEDGCGFLVERGEYHALNLIGGPIESTGRLKYIDGCTDTLLVPPVKRGDACLNALFFPAGIDQTLHTHPSIRAGIVASGYGVCRDEFSTVPLSPRGVFVIDKDAIHGFRTDSTTGMVVIAYHPDSDFGPIDEDHPMINRTFVGEVSASLIPEIHTN